MEKDQNDQLEIILKSPIGNETPSVETLININSQLSKITFDLAQHYGDKVNQMDLNVFNPRKITDEEMDAIMGYSLWKFFSRTVSVMGLAICQNTSEPVERMEQMLNDFLKEMGNLENVQKSQNKKEETFFKENPDIN